MTAKDIVRAIKRNVPWQDVLCLVLWVEPTDKANEESEDVVTPLLGVVAIERKAIRRLVAPVRNWGWVVTLPAMRKTGVAIFVPRSRQAYKSGRLLHVSNWQRDNLTLRKRWVTYARS